MSVIIRLQNLPMSANASNIRRFFGGLSIPEGGVHIVGGADGDAFIAFSTDEDARKAMLLDRQLINGASVRLLLSSKTEMQSVIDSARSSVLLSPVLPITSHSVPHKTQAMQALDVTSTTLPSTFSSYRHESNDHVNKRPTSYMFGHPPAPISQPPFETFRGEDTQGNSRFVRERPDTVPVNLDHPRPLDQDYDRSLDIPFRDFGVPPNRSFPPEVHDTERSFDICRLPPSPSLPRPPFPEDVSKNIPVDQHYGIQERNHRPFMDSGHRQPPFDVENRSPRQFIDRADPRHHPLSDNGDTQSYRNLPNSNWQDKRLFPPPIRDDIPPGSRPAVERDFSVRPPWLCDDNVGPGAKRSLPPVEFADYSRKRKAPPPPRSSDSDGDGETEFVVRVTLPVTDVGVKTIFDLFRGVHIISKWGIRIEGDTQQRSTGYVFIMVTSRDSMDRSLANDKRMYRGKPIYVKPSSLGEFYAVSDSSFNSKCPPHILKKLPQGGQKISSPYYADGCLEVTEIPPDTSKNEIIRFLGAPGLTPADVVIANFPSSDREIAKSSDSVRALITLPSANDLDILLSAKPRPLRPDGLFPPVCLTAISKVQLDYHSTFSQDSEQKPEHPAVPVVPIKQITTEPLTCAYLSGLSLPLTESEVILIFKTVLIPGDSVRMIGPTNTSAYIDFISENNCRRAITDVDGPDSTIKHTHPNIKFKSISRADMEHFLGSSQKESALPVSSAPPDTRNDRPREVSHPPWEPRYPPKGNRHMSPALPLPAPSRPHFGEPHYDRENGYHMDPHAGPRRFRSPYDGNANPHASHHVPPENMPLPPSRRPDLVTVRLANLPQSVTVDQLASIMRDYYFVLGSIRLRRDMQGMPMGEGLVDFNSTYDGDRAIHDLHGYRIAGRPLVLHYDRRP